MFQSNNDRHAYQRIPGGEGVNSEELILTKYLLFILLGL